MYPRLLIVGSEGAMGKRYSAIVNYINKTYEKDYLVEHYDIKLNKTAPDYNSYQYIILATPTDTHELCLKELIKIKYKGAVLCEKPMIKNVPALRSIFDSKLDVDMMFQYSYLIDSKPFFLKAKDFEFNQSANTKLETTYDFYKTSNTTDGLYWDCMQIIGLHKGHVQHCNILNRSPIWHCQINDNLIDIHNMDIAYVNAVYKWLSGFRFDKRFLLLMHEKVFTYIKSRL